LDDGRLGYDERAGLKPIARFQIFQISLTLHFGGS
jgi:hypothetical protein